MCAILKSVIIASHLMAGTPPGPAILACAFFAQVGLCTLLSSFFGSSAPAPPPAPVAVEPVVHTCPAAAVGHPDWLLWFFGVLGLGSGLLASSFCQAVAGWALGHLPGFLVGIFASRALDQDIFLSHGAGGSWDNDEEDSGNVGSSRALVASNAW